jgi:hypothetical protein
LPADLGLDPATSSFRTRALLRCSWRRGHVDGPAEGWVGDPIGRRVEVGWGGYARYDLDLEGPVAHVNVTTEVEPRDAAIALLLTVLPIAMPLVEIEPLHGAAVASGERADLLLGTSGSGKSTIARSLHALGYPGLSDDVCAIDGDGVLWPGPPLHAPVEGVSSSLGRYDGKVVLRLPPPPAPWLPVGAVFALRRAPVAEIVVEALRGRDAFEVILGNVRGPRFLADTRRRTQLRVVASVAERPVHLVRFDAHRHPSDAVAEELARWMRQMPRLSS